jgi:hypothetical protein
MSKRCSILAPESHARCQKSTMHLGPHEATKLDEMVTVWSKGIQPNEARDAWRPLPDREGPSYQEGYEEGWAAALRWAGVL